MLTRQFDDLLASRLPEDAAARLLLQLTPEQIDLPTFCRLVATLQETAAQSISFDLETIDCCGTGGSGQAHYNTSTTVAFVLAAAGLRVAKFGNRAASGKSGSFDFLEILGFRAVLSPEASSYLLFEHGLAFLFAPQYYPVLGTLRDVRQRLGVKTVFNYIGPLLNPARPAFRLTGVSDEKMQGLIASYLAGCTGNKIALVVRSDTGLDEIAAYGRTVICEVRDGVAHAKASYEAEGTEDAHDLDTLDAVENARIFHELLSGTAPERFVRSVCLNAGAALYAAGRVGGIDDGAAVARALFTSGEVRNKYEKLREAYERLHSRD